MESSIWLLDIFQILTVTDNNMMNKAQCLNNNKDFAWSYVFVDIKNIAPQGKAKKHFEISVLLK